MIFFNPNFTLYGMLNVALQRHFAEEEIVSEDAGQIIVIKIYFLRQHIKL